MSYHHVILSNTYSTRVRLGLRSELDWLEVGVLHRYLCMLLHSDQRVKYHLGPETEIGKKLKKQCFLVHVSVWVKYYEEKQSNVSCRSMIRPLSG